MPDDTPQFPPDPLPTIIPGASVNLLAGAPGVGKTALLAWMLSRFRDQAPVFGHTPAAIPKLGLLCADRSWTQSTQHWLERAGYPDVPAYSILDDPNFAARRLRDKKQRIDILQEGINVLELPWGSFLAVDPLALFLGGNILDYDACAVACIEIRQICRRQGITILGTAHSSKQLADKAKRYLRLQDRIAGSTSLLGFTDTQMYLASPEEIGEEYYLFHWTPHLAPSEGFRLKRDTQGLFIPYDEDAPEAVQADLHTNAADQFLILIAEAPELTNTQDLLAAAELLGINRATLFRYLRQLQDRRLILKVGTGKYCRPRPQ